MRRRLLLLAAAFPFAAASVAHGCSDEPPFESACRWLADPENCAREFRENLLANPNPENPNGDCRTYDPMTPKATWPTEASPIAPGISNGAFMMRAKLDTCVLNAGGSVTVDPPIDLTMFPPAADAGPVTYTFTFVNADTVPCGSAMYGGPYNFSLTINPPPDAGSTAMSDAGMDATAPAVDSGDNDDTQPVISSGTYTEANAPGRSAFDVTCPDGETHHFNLNELTGPPGADAGFCADVANALPSASMQIYLGGTDTPGALSFAINFPPDSTPANDDMYPAGITLQPNPIVYFNCAIPGAMETCADGVKDGTETDVDCGGPQIPSMDFCGNCPPRCAAMQNCICDGDCAKGNTCQVNAMGMRQCAPPAGPSFPKCAYTNKPQTCPPQMPDGGGMGGSGTGDGGTDAAADG